MRKVLLKNVDSNMKLARAIYSADGQILLAEGVTLKTEYVNRLHSFGITEVYIEDDISRGIQVSDVIHDRTRMEAKVLVKNIMDDCKINVQIKTERVKEVINRILDELLDNRDILVNLSDIKTVDDYTFAHSVNVCVLSLIIGIKVGLNQLRLRDLGVGALLHDIGKTLIPEKILKKPTRLTDDEFEEIKKHTVLGYEILKGIPSINSSSAFIALAHHERYNGNGYPLKIKGQNIHLFARIVAVADVYDALTSDRVYRKKLKVHEVIEYITGLGTRHFDKTIVQYFIKYIAIYPVGTGVILSTKQKGIVIGVNREFPTRPIVRIVYNEDGTRNEDHEELDLTKRLNVVIVDTCEL